jgi:pimeloyl-ACP methyl ester carboxylesterase
MAQAGFAKLDPREEHFRIPSHREGLSLFLRYLPALHEAQAHKNVVLYVHGGTFPSGLSIAHRFDGVSWRDELAASGFHCWGLDFHGFGRLSDPYPEISESAEKHPPLGRADDASRQLERAVRFICSHHRVSRISLIAHSWGSIVAGRFAGEHPRLVERLVLFGPIACRARRTDPQRLPAWRLISLKDQWDRFVADVPPGEPPVLAKHHFDEWGEAYLDIDPESRTRLPPAVKTPSGAFQDIYDAWAGELAYDPALVRLDHPRRMGRHVHGGRYEMAFQCAEIIAHPTHRHDQPRHHLLHLEESRYALYRETEAFLAGNDAVAAHKRQAA